MKTKLFTSIILLFLTSVFGFAGKPVASAAFKVSGNCGMCKNRIEKSLSIREVSSASWDKKTKMLTIRYNDSAISLDSLQRRIASVGHDTEKYNAADSVYSKLPECCLYRK
jgi:hypothetical protein